MLCSLCFNVTFTLMAVKPVLGSVLLKNRIMHVCLEIGTPSAFWPVVPFFLGQLPNVFTT